MTQKYNWGEREIKNHFKGTLWISDFLRNIRVLMLIELNRSSSMTFIWQWIRVSIILTVWPLWNKIRKSINHLLFRVIQRARLALKDMLGKSLLITVVRRKKKGNWKVVAFHQNWYIGWHTEWWGKYLPKILVVFDHSSTFGLIYLEKSKAHVKQL